MVREKFLGRGKYLALGLVLTMALFSFYGCSGDDGSAGAPGTPGTSTGTVSGVVTNNITSTAVAGATITTSPAIQGVSISTNASGAYSANLPIGTYTLTISKTNFNNATATVTLAAGQAVTKDVALVPKGNVVVNAGADQSGAPDGTVSLAALVEVLDGSAGTPACAWTQTEGAPAAIATPAACATSVTLANSVDYKAALFADLEDLDRTMVQPINPHAMELGGEAAFEVTVTVDGNVVSDEVAVTVALPYAVNGGINTVPRGVPVLLHAKGSLADWTWSIDTAPGTSTATLDDATAQNPSFTPDVAGRYDISVTNSGTLVNSISVYAGTWEGTMGNVAGLSSECTGCHVPGATPVGEVRAKMDAWLNSGHAEIFSQNIDNPAGHWSLSCASCHTVGYDEAADNNGFDEAVASEGWIVPPHGDVGTWDAMVADSSLTETVQRANIQCENCHGPNSGTTLHLNGTLMDDARVSLASDVCGACHGEPLRHARFQQWETSAHANYELAIDEGMSASCARCHAAQGFLAWLPQLEAGDPGNLVSPITWDADSVHPQTCATCHPVHDPGDTSGAPGVNNAKVRVDGSTSLLPAGFMAMGVGKGATCMTCHNSRNGLHNNDNLPSGTTNDRAPHVAAQGDVLMGQNAYFVAVGGGSRSPHSFIGDSCVTCHMELTPPPAELSYNLGGTNHSFAASLSICADCHGTFDGGTLQATVASMLDELKAEMETYMLAAITAYQGGGGVIVAQDANSVDHVLGTVSSVVAEESHGRQAFIVTDDASCATPCDVQVRKFVRDDIAGGGNNNGAYDAADPMLIPEGDALVQAGWNYYLIHGDGSMGVHNPSFTLDVIEASIAAL